MQAVTAVGLDIAKSVFQVHGIDAEGKATRWYRGVCDVALLGARAGQAKARSIIDQVLPGLASSSTTRAVVARGGEGGGYASASGRRTPNSSNNGEGAERSGAEVYAKKIGGALLIVGIGVRICAMVVVCVRQQNEAAIPKRPRAEESETDA